MSIERFESIKKDAKISELVIKDRQIALLEERLNLSEKNQDRFTAFVDSVEVRKLLKSFDKIENSSKTIDEL